MSDTHRDIPVQCSAESMQHCGVGPVLQDVRSSLDSISNRLGAIQHTQSIQADQLMLLDRKTDKAVDTALEAKRMADQARAYADDMVGAMRSHFDVVSATLRQQGDAISEQAKLILQQTTTLAQHTSVLTEQTRELGEQSKALELLTQAELKRSTREALMEQYAKEQRDWVRWSVPFAFTLLTALVGVAIWIASKMRL